MGPVGQRLSAQRPPRPPEPVCSSSSFHRRALRLPPHNVLLLLPTAAARGSPLPPLPLPTATTARTSSSFRHRCPLAHRVLLLPTTAAMDHAASPAIIAPLAASRPENQLTQFGDGFIGFVSTYLGNHCKELIWMGLHPSEIIVGYNKVISKVCSHFQSDRSGIIKTCRM
jgi:hypothetical protein